MGDRTLYCQHISHVEASNTEDITHALYMLGKRLLQPLEENIAPTPLHCYL